MECNWLQDVLEENGVRPGEGLNIIKFHDFLSIPGIIREFGCAMNLDTGAFERKMKFVKQTDEQTRTSRADDGREHVFQRAVARDQDARYQAYKASPASASEESPECADDDSACGSDVTQDEDSSSMDGSVSNDESSSTDDEEEKVFRFSDATLFGKHRYRKTGAWKETKCMLERGSNGPAIDIDEALSMFSAGEDISLGHASFFVRECITHVDPASLAREKRIIFPGHCVQMKDNSYAQVILPRVLGEEDEENEGAHCSLLAHFDYVDPSQRNGNHPVLPIPYLRRGSCFFGRIADILRRPGPGNSASVTFARNFIVNPFVFKRRRGPALPPVCLSCPQGFPGKGVLKPAILGS